jgi:hypothetical protein
MIRSRDFYRGLVLGLGIMYVMDPDQGRTRRARIRAQLTRLRSDPAHPDASLAERVRATFVRCVSDPRAINVDSRGGCILLSGSILRSEVGELIQAVSSVGGVTEVVNRLSTHASGERAPSLRSGHSRRYPAPGSSEWVPGMQLAAGIAGAAALALGVTRVAARYRANRLEELEAEMPEYAMLR